MFWIKRHKSFDLHQLTCFKKKLNGASIHNTCATDHLLKSIWVDVTYLTRILFLIKYLYVLATLCLEIFPLHFTPTCSAYTVQLTFKGSIWFMVKIMHKKPSYVQIFLISLQEKYKFYGSSWEYLRTKRSIIIIEPVFL